MKRSQDSSIRKALELVEAVENSLGKVSEEDIHNVLGHLCRGEPHEAAAYCLAIKADLKMMPSDYVVLISSMIKIARAQGIQ